MVNNSNSKKKNAMKASFSSILDFQSHFWEEIIVNCFLWIFRVNF